MGETGMYTTVRTASILLLVLALSASTAQAQDLVGKTAPPIDAQEWLNAEEGMSLKKLKGKIIFLEFTATW